jgi:hypothetical protein
VRGAVQMTPHQHGCTSDACRPTRVRQNAQAPVGELKSAIPFQTAYSPSEAVGDFKRSTSHSYGLIRAHVTVLQLCVISNIALESHLPTSAESHRIAASETGLVTFPRRFLSRGACSQRSMLLCILKLLSNSNDDSILSRGDIRPLAPTSSC